MRLLLIEDERTLCDAIARRLRRLGYSVDLTYDGEQAMQLLEVEHYDLVLLDLNLPKQDGMTVLRTLRQTDRETRVLILSARSGTADKVDGLDAGANDYLSKPFALAELEARIRSLTQRQFIRHTALRYEEPHCHSKRASHSPDQKGGRYFGVSSSQSGAPCQSGGTDRPCLGQQRGWLQQRHSRSYLRSSEEAARCYGF